MKFKVGDIVIVVASNKQLRGWKCDPIITTGYVGKITSLSPEGHPILDDLSSGCVGAEKVKLAKFAETALYKALDGNLE